MKQFFKVIGAAWLTGLVLLGERESARLISKVRSQFPGLLGAAR